MEKFDYCIVGSGLFGSICAYELHKRGFSVLVVEARDHIGGNIYTKNIEGINVHMYGAHIFHTSNKNTWDYINQFAPFNNFINSPMARYKDEIYNLPFNMNTFVRLFKDVLTPNDALNKIEAEKRAYYTLNPKNLKEQAINLVGPTIYEKLIESYTEKQWGKPCEELPSFIIKRLPVRFSFDNNYFNDTYQGIPIGGYTQIIEKMLEGVEVKLNYNYFDHKDEIKANKTIYTGAIDEYYNYIFGPLEYRSLRFETSVLDMENYQGVAVCNYTDRETPYTRIIEHKFFEKTNSEKTIITREYPAQYEKGKERYYPINNDENNALYERYKNLANKEKDVYFGGRLGLYKYLDMDKVIEKALEFIDKILA